MQSQKFLITGQVQGVGFRYFVYRHAQVLGLSGYVRNLPDGSVEVLAEGPEATLRQLEQLVRQGPSSAIVREVRITAAETAGGRTDFRIER